MIFESFISDLTVFSQISNINNFGLICEKKNLREELSFFSIDAYQEFLRLKYKPKIFRSNQKISVSSSQRLFSCFTSKIIDVRNLAFHFLPGHISSIFLLVFVHNIQFIHAFVFEKEILTESRIKI